MSPSLTVRTALPEDADAFAACHLACWREAYEELWGPERFDEFEQRALLGRSLEDVVSMDERWKIASHRRDTTRPLRRRRSVVRRQRRGQGASNDDTEWNHVVLGDPFAEGEHSLPKHGRRIRQTGDALRLDTRVPMRLTTHRPCSAAAGE